MLDWAQRILNGDARALARAATAVENRTSDGIALMRELFPRTGKATVIGITGAPGAGKSTLVDQLTRELRGQRQRVGIIAVDPSSPYSGGAILGDRIRMESHHADAGVFIRSMATRGCVGGIAATTADLALLFDAAGCDTVLIETVGVGQDEVEIARLAGITVVVLAPGMGDDVQAIKAGVMEIADVFVVNKADSPGAEQLVREIKYAQGLAQHPEAWIAPIISTVALEGTGIVETLAAIRAFPGRERTAGLWSLRLREMLRERLLLRIPADEFQAAALEVAARRQDPYTVIDEWMKRL